MKTAELWLSAGLCLCCLVIQGHEPGENPDSVTLKSEAVHKNSYDFFASDEPLHVTLQFNVSEFLKTKKEPVFLPAEFRIQSTDQETVSVKVKIKARGFMRLSYCQFPPLLLKFCDKKASLSGKSLNGGYKIVTPCMHNEKFENYVLKEYLAYRLYNQVTSYSLLTRLLLIRIEDTGKPGRTYEAYGFMIEDPDQMAERNNAVVIKNKNLCQRNMEPCQMNRVALFNYMIGNTDWSVPTLHNIKILKPLELMTDKGIPVPYDFDYAGLVNAQYAAPANELPIKDVSERYFQGICENSGDLEAIIDEFGALKDRMLGTIDNFELLPESVRKPAFSYIEKFYRVYKNDDALMHTLSRTCKQY